MFVHIGVEQIAVLALFRGLTSVELAWVGERLHSRIFQTGTNVITIDQPGEVVYAILNGTVKVHIEQADGTDVILAILGPGDTLGEMSLLDTAGRSANAETLEESTLIWMDRVTFQQCLKEIPTVSLNLIRILSARLRLANELIQALASLDVYGRVARQLLAFAEKYGEEDSNGQTTIPVRLTQGDIADLVGASRKRVNQVMVTFKHQNLISVDAGSHITVHQRESLARYCR